MDKDEFEWDAAKAESNLKKHGVSFEAAQRVFDDAFAVESCHAASESGEIRYVIAGMVHDVILAVVYTERRSNTNDLGKKSHEA